MNRDTRRLCALRRGVCALFAMSAPLALAQTPLDEKNAADELDTVEVVGMRASLATAQGIKREKIEIVDSVVASDINKLPDFSTTDALSRVTGIQIARDCGEGGDVGGVPGASGVSIRGLTQVETPSPIPMRISSWAIPPWSAVSQAHARRLRFPARFR